MDITKIRYNDELIRIKASSGLKSLIRIAMMPVCIIIIYLLLYNSSVRGETDIIRLATTNILGLYGLIIMLILILESIVLIPVTFDLIESVICGVKALWCILMDIPLIIFKDDRLTYNKEGSNRVEIIYSDINEVSYTLRDEICTSGARLGLLENVMHIDRIIISTSEKKYIIHSDEVNISDMKLLVMELIKRTNIDINIWGK